MLELLLDHCVHDSEPRVLTMLNPPSTVILDVIPIPVQLYPVPCTFSQFNSAPPLLP